MALQAAGVRAAENGFAAGRISVAGRRRHDLVHVLRRERRGSALRSPAATSAAARPGVLDGRLPQPPTGSWPPRRESLPASAAIKASGPPCGPETPARSAQVDLVGALPRTGPLPCRPLWPDRSSPGHRSPRSVARANLRPVARATSRALAAGVPGGQRPYRRGALGGGGRSHLLPICPARPSARFELAKADQLDRGRVAPRRAGDRSRLPMRSGSPSGLSLPAVDRPDQRLEQPGLRRRRVPAAMAWSSTSVQLFGAADRGQQQQRPGPAVPQAACRR